MLEGRWGGVAVGSEEVGGFGGGERLSVAPLPGPAGGEVGNIYINHIYKMNI